MGRFGRRQRFHEPGSHSDANRGDPAGKKRRIAGVGASQGVRITRVYYGWYLVGVGFLSLFVGSGGSTTFTVLLPEMVRDLGWPYTTVIGASSIGVVLGALIGPWVGRIIDRRGARLVLCVSVTVAALSTAATGLTTEPWHLFLSYGIISGATRAVLMNVAPGAIIANWFQRRRAPAYGAAAMGPPAASILLPTLVALGTQAFSWRGAWFAVAIGTIVIGLPPMAILVRRRPEDMGLRPDGDPPEASVKGPLVSPAGAGPAAGAPDVGQPVAPMPGPADWTLREAVHSPGFWGVVGFMALIGVMPNTVYLFLVSSLRSQGLSETGAAAALSVMGLTQVVARVGVWTPLVARLGVQTAVRAWAVMLLLAALFLALARGEAEGYLAAGFLGLGMGANLVLQLIVWPEYFGRTAVGAITGAANVVSGLAGAAGPLLAAALVDITGVYTWSYLFMAFAVFLGLILQVVVGKPRKPEPASLIATA